MVRACWLVLIACGAVVADDKKTTPAERATAAMDKANKAKSVKVTVREGEADALAEFGTSVYQRDTGFRIEKRDANSKEITHVAVVNVKDEKMLELDMKAKTAEARERRGIKLDAVIPDVFRLPATVTDGGEEKIGAVAARVYAGVAGRPGGRAVAWTLWVDPTTGLPVRVRLDKAGNGGKPVAMEMDFADWDKEYDAKQFTTDLPAGFKLAEPKK